MAKYPRRPNSFTLVELLTVMAIIAILLGILLAAMSGVMRTASRDRARAEIQAMSAALESYKSDNGIYPIVSAGGFGSISDYTTASPTTPAGQYQASSAFLYEQLTGTTNYGDLPLTGSGTKVYMTFKSGQLGNDTSGAAGSPIYIRDPFGNSYGYYSTTNGAPQSVAPNNGAGFFDLWSTGGDTANPSVNPAIWVNNWTN
jgi:prepilin-type N-terminal cleavage/methylation domain-containing protein